MDKLKVIGLALNMLVCALLPDAKRRETLSGYVGRQSYNYRAPPWRRRFFNHVRDIIDALHPSEKMHCLDTYMCEALARKALAYESQN